MNSRPVRRVLFVLGVVIAAMGMFAGSKTHPEEWRWDSVASIAIIAAGLFVAFIGLVGILDPTPAPTEEEERERSVVPARYVPLIFGGFIAACSLIAALVVGNYIGRNEGYLTFVLAFVLANLVFGLGLAFVRAPSYR